MKWEPAALMVLLVLLGLWLVMGPSAQRGLEPRAGAEVHSLRIGSTRGAIEILRDQTGREEFRLLSRDGFASPVLDASEFERIFGPALSGEVRAQSPNWLFRLLNITSWGSLVWVTIGFGGQLAFTGRMLIQWLLSEKRRVSTVPPLFWWLSLLGAVMLFAYFVWRQDAVGVLGQSSGIVIYGRNLRLIAKQRRREARGNPEGGAPGTA